MKVNLRIPAAAQDVHDICVIVGCCPAGLGLLGDGVRRGGQDQPGSFWTGKLQTQLHKIPVIMAQPGKLPANGTQGVVTKLRLDPAKTVLPPHGTAAVFDGHNGAVVGILEHLQQTLTQFTGQRPVAGGGFRVHIHFPLLAAAVRAGRGDTAEAGIIFRNV